MMRAARKGADDTAEKLNKKPPVILGVTMLTSISQEVMENEFKVDKNVSSFAISLAKLAKEAGLDGVVASAVEVENIKKNSGKILRFYAPESARNGALKMIKKELQRPRRQLKEGPII